MNDFVFHHPTKIIFGRGTLAAIGAEAAGHGQKILLVYGQGSIKINKTYTQVIDSLQQAKLQVVEFSGIRANPLLGDVRNAICLAKKEKVEAVVAIGGGSVLDSAKAIAAGSLVDHDPWLFFSGKKSVKTALPILTAPTLAASGSEANGGMVLTNETKRLKFGYANRNLFPRVSILDPTTTFSVPANHTAYGAVDSITHALEFYLTTSLSFTPLQDRLIEALIATVLESCDHALGNPEDYQARANLMWAAALALNGITAAGLGRVGFPMHLIEHALSALYNIPHGAGLAIVMPGAMTWMAAKKPRKFAQFAERLFNISGTNETEKALAGIAALKKWLITIGCPVSLKDIGVSGHDIPTIAENALAQAKIWRMKEYSQETIEAVLNRCL